MKKIKKISAILLTLMLCVGLMTVPVLAAESAQDGLEVTLTTDKETYGQSEQIVATLTVKNTNDYAVKNVSMENVIPQGYTLAEGSTATKQLDTLDAGEEATLTVAYNVVESNEPASEQPIIPGATPTSPVQTGDNSVKVMWGCILGFGCLMVITAMVIMKKGKKLVSLFFCMVIAGAAIVSTPNTVNAAEIQVNTISVSTEITVNNNALTLEGKVDYLLPGEIVGNVRGYSEDGSVVALEGSNISVYSSDQNALETQSDSLGNYEMLIEDEGVYSVDISHEGYIPLTIYNNEVIYGQTTYLNNVILIRDTGEEVNALIEGTVKDALTGEGIEGVSITFRENWNNKSGEIVTDINGQELMITTDAEGKYSVELPEGYYTAECSMDGYITGYANLICVNTNTQPQDIVLTPILAENEYRIVLTWSESPRDLDSHISGPTSDGERFHVYFSRKEYSVDGEVITQLDLDDTTSYGPETITLEMIEENGIYKYAVHDYSNRSSDSSNQLSLSGAKVVLYKGDTLLATYEVPVNVPGTVWNVFEIEGNMIRTINTMDFIMAPRDVAQ